MSEDAKIIITVCFVIFFLCVTINIILDIIEDKKEIHRLKKWKIILRNGFGLLIKKYGNDFCFELGEDDSWLEFKAKKEIMDNIEKCKKMVAELNMYLGLETCILQMLFFNDKMKYREIHANGFIIVMNCEEESEIQILYCRSSE